MTLKNVLILYKKKFLNVVSVKYDCDTDALLVEVKKDGPACHTGVESYFFNSLFEA